MEETLKDIKTKLEGRFYQNEQHVRFSLVARILQQLGWDIWNPQEVYPEFYVTPNEDKTKIDWALFINLGSPSVFIEVKSVGKIDAPPDLAKFENQLRDYNRNLTAIFSIITDGQKWRFYFSRTGGEFSEKCFKVIDLLKDDLSTVENSLKIFLAKSEIMNGNAEKNANNYLQLNQKQRAMVSVLPDAQRKVNEPPYPRLPDALVELVKSAGHKISLEEAEDFIKTSKKSNFPDTHVPKEEVIIFHPNGPRPGGRKMKINGESFDIHNSYDIIVNTAEWLIRNGKLNAHMPLKIGHAKNYLISTESKPIAGTQFRVPKQLSNGLWINIHGIDVGHIHSAEKLLEKCGERADALTVDAKQG